MAKTHSPEFLKLVDAAKQRITEITVDEVLARRTRGDAFHLLDVREDGEWHAGHATGAEHMGRGVIERDIEMVVPDKGTPIVLYCGGGFRSALAAESIQKMGYTNVRSMAGGWSEWLARGGGKV
ncbi:MAG: rhodanese-like domain-containing protein [Polyangia bacterium]